MINTRKIKDNFFHNLDEIDQINRFGDDVIELTIDFLLALKKQNEEAPAERYIFFAKLVLV